MKKRFLIWLCLLTSLIVFGFIIEDEPLKKILAQLEKYSTEYPQEKVHLHFDKPYYAIGDSIWFKAYVVTGEKNQLSNISHILYVDLINDKDSVQQSLRVPLIWGLGWGSLTLPDNLQEGNYRVRAYTSWMRNFGTDYFFDKTIAIGNALSNNISTEVNYAFSKEKNGEKVLADIHYQDIDGQPIANKEVNYDVQLNSRNIAKGKGITDDKGNLKITFINNQPFILKSGKISTIIHLDKQKMASKSFPIKTTSSDVDVQFFPEGGDVLTGIRSKIAFKAVGADGLGVAISGYISDRSNNKITEFKSEHAGLGFFALDAQPEQSYKANIRFADGSEKAFNLPRILPQGYMLSASNIDPENLIIRIAVTPELISQGDLTLVAQSNGVVKYVSKTKLDKSIVGATVPKKRFPTGILQLTLFSPQGEPVAERIVFINHDDPLNITLKTDKTTYQKRGKVKLTLDAKDRDGNPVIGGFSLAVTDEAKVPYDELNETTILSNLLLTSDLKGYIEQPNYYFTDINEAKIRQLDILMLTQGWRRFVWKNILSDTYPALTFQPEKSMEVSGKVTTLFGKPVIGGKVTLFSSTGNFMLIDTLTNAEGRFKFDNLYFTDSTKFAVQARNQKDRKNVEIVLDQLPAQLVTRNKNAAEIKINVNHSLIPYLNNRHNQLEDLKRYGMLNSTILLEEVKVVQKKQTVRNSSNLNGSGHADAVITSQQLQNCIDLLQCLQGRVAGLVVQDGLPYLMRNMGTPMHIILDGMNVGSEFLSSINPNDVETIEVLKSISNTAIYGMNGGGGVLIISTKRGTANSSYRTYAPGIISYSPKGYFKGRAFYSPNYDDPKVNTKMRDLRTTIYWNPHIATDSTGKTVVEFFNADGAGNYRAVVEGINMDGKLGRKVFRYTVK